MPERLPVLHAVTDAAVVARGDFLRRARRAMEAGGADLAVHLRAPGAGGRQLFDLARALVMIARKTGSALLVNDRVDVALAVDADGVQLGRRSLDAADARRLLGAGKWAGASVHSAEDAREAAEGGADFLVAGPVFATPSHPESPGAGTGLIGELTSFGRPVIAIGGITPARAAELRDAGAAGMAAIRGIWDTRSTGAAVRRYLEAWRA